jgi:general secretion pathway protein D
MKKPRLTAALMLATAMVPFARAEMNEPQPARHVLSLDNVDIAAFIEDVSMVTGYTFIVHPEVQSAKVTVTSKSPMTTTEIFEVFQSTLRVHGFAVQPAGRNVYRIVPESAAIGDARLEGVGPNAIITEVFRLDHADVMQAAQAIKPLIDSQGQVVANPASGTLVVVDYASNMARVRDIVTQMDTSNVQTASLTLRNVPATEVAEILTTLEAREGGGVGGLNFTVAASGTSNSIVVRGDEVSVDRAVRVAQDLDASDPVRDNVRVISLNNAEAGEIIPVLERMVESAKAASPTRPPVIAAHPQSNSLVLSGSPELLLSMERVVQALDQRRAQVLVEAIIVEMSDATAKELGVQFLLSGTGNSSTPFASTNFTRSAPNLLALAGALADDNTLGAGNTFRNAAVNSLLSLSGITFGVGGSDGDTLFGAVINAVENDQKSRVLSKPFSMTLDNGTSSLSIGQDVPVTRGEVLADSNSNPFRTVDRKEIGVKLGVTPRIGADDTIRLDIQQEVSSIAGTVGTVSPDFIFNKRTFDTSVLADDGDIVVIGGLIEQIETVNDSKVPLLGDIPLLGNLFKSEGKELTRTNLMVFIKPTIVRDRADSEALTARNYRYIRAEALLREDEDAASLDRFIQDVLGSEPPVQ